MNKEQFFNDLEEHLRGEVPDAELRDSISYYRGYFSEQENLGKSDQQILEELGDPRYIARSIVDARGVENEVSRSGGYYDEDGNYNYEEYTETGSNYNQRSSHSYQYQEDVVNDPEPSPVKNIMSSVIRVAVIVGILLLIGILLHALLPIILVIIVIVLVSSLFRRS